MELKNQQLIQTLVLFCVAFIFGGNSCSSIRQEISAVTSLNSPPDAQALKEARKIFDQYFTPYKDSYLVFGEGPNFRQELRFANVQPIITSSKTDDADNRNGIEWKGSVVYVCKSYRYYIHKEELSKWEPCTDYTYRVLQVDLEKNNSTWNVKFVSSGSGSLCRSDEPFNDKQCQYRIKKWDISKFQKKLLE